MSNDQPTRRARDPVCGMSVRVDVAEHEGLVVEYDRHAYYFCRPGCRDQFAADPARFVHSHANAGAATHDDAPEIDDGMRRWYESCSCCLSDAYPEIKAALDAERAATAQPMAERGICEVAEAAEEIHA